MAATDMFETFTASLSEQERKHLQTFIKSGRTDLLEARSEDARLRIVSEVIMEAHRLLKPTKR